MSARDANQTIFICIENLITIVADALHREIPYANVRHVVDASWKLIDCLVEHKIITEEVKSAKLKKKRRAIQERPVTCNVKQRPVLYLKKRSKSASRCQERKAHRSPQNIPNRWDYDGEEYAVDKMPKAGNDKNQELKANKKMRDCLYNLKVKVDTAIKRDIHYAKVDNVDVLSWKFIDCLVEQEIVDESAHSSRHFKGKTCKVSPVTCLQQVDQIRTLVSSGHLRGRSKSVSRCEQAEFLSVYPKKLDFNNDYDEDNVDEEYEAEYEDEDDYIDDDDDADNDEEECIDELGNNYGISKNDGKYERLAHEYFNKYRELRNFMTRRPDECINCKALHDRMNRYRAERNELKFDKEELENRYKKIMNEKSDETLILKNKTFENTIEYQKKLIFEFQKREKQLQNELIEANRAADVQKFELEKNREEKDEAKSKLLNHVIENDEILHQKNMLQQQAKDQIDFLKKKVEEKERDLQQIKQCNADISNKMDEIERKRKEFPSRLAEQQKEKYEIEHKYKIQISDLKTQKDRADEYVRKARKDMEAISLNLEKQQKLFNLERRQFEKKIETLKLQCDEKLKTSENKWSRSVNSAKHHNYKKEEDRFIDLSIWKRNTQIDLYHGNSEENMAWQRERDRLREEINEKSCQLKELEHRFEREKNDSNCTIDKLQREKECLKEDTDSLKAKLEHIQNQLNSYKYEQNGKVDNLLQQKKELEKDKKLLRDKIYALENVEITSEERFNGINEEKLALKKEQGRLQEALREKSKQLNESESRSITMKTDLISLQNMEKENQDLKALNKRVKNDLDILEKRYKKETADRISYENSATRYKDENDRLRKERNSAQVEIQKLRREKEESSLNLNTEKVLVREEIEKKEKEKSDLLALFKNDKGKHLHKIQQLELEVKTLKSRSMEDKDKIQQLEHEIKMFNSRFVGEKVKQNSSYELLQLKHDLETYKHQKTKSENECDELQKENTDLENQLLSLNSKFEQYEDYERNITNLEKQIEDLQESYRSTTAILNEAERQKHKLNEALKDQKQENRDVTVKMEILDTEKKELENQLRLNSSHYKAELEQKKEELNRLKKSLVSDEEKVMFSKDEILKLQKDNAELKHNQQNLSKQLKESENRLALNKSSLGNRCEELQNILQDKEQEINNLKLRFQELADSKETSEVLEKRIINLQQEKSELNQRLQELEVLKRQVHKLDFENSEMNKRLEINNKEKSSILIENKELKNILQEKLSEVKRLETRLQQYAEKFEDIPALKRHMDKLRSDNDELNLKLQEYAAELEGIPSLKRRIENLQTDNAELEKRDKHKDGLLQKSESTVQKMQKDNQKLQTEIISQNQNYDTLKIKLESLKDKNLELDERLRRRSPVVVAEPKNCQNCFKYRNDISDLKREINDLRDRLSEAAGNKLRDNNPNIADLSDMNRPTSLAEKFSSLYTDEYTDAMEVIEDDMDEAASVKVMLDWLKSCYDWCQRLAKEQRETLINRSIGFMQEHGGQKVVLSDRCLIFVKEFQKKIAVESLAVVGQICHVKSVTQQTLSRENYIVKYIKKCSELCWMMQISDPPLYVNFDVNSGENLNKNDYNVFTKSGSKIDYLVWPVLYLHKTGPMLAKGVAQGK